MRAILIDPMEQKVSEIDYSGNYKDIYDIIQTGITAPRHFDVVSIPFGNDGIYIDDEGLYAPMQFMWSFNWHRWKEPIKLVNKALVIGCDDNGDAEDSTSGVEIINHIKWGAWGI